eukprot:TRINITY_DN814_c0_g1_i1.p1 TRINITY_DN814_c0_g1~~TRINITY_DN814_c0_g1_i1.p1  ORF type:complete len:677 (-),score=87.73 TRINITY_DN814_c0_g1_i1:428-2371(-)
MQLRASVTTSSGSARKVCTTVATKPLICQFAEAGDSRSIEELLKSNETSASDLTATRDSHGQTPLHLAALEAKIDVVKLLLTHKADVHVRDKNNWTPLHCSAAGSGERSLQHLEVCELLLRAGAQPNAITETNTSVMHYLVRYPYSPKLMEVLELLKEKGADVDVVEQMGDCPLHQAAFRGCKETCTFLIAAGAAVTALNQNGETPLHLAVRGGRKDIVELLLANGADPFIVGQNGTARDVALTCNNQEIIDLIDEAESDSAPNDFTNQQILSSVSNHTAAVAAVTTALPESVLRSRQISVLLEKTDVFYAFNEMLDAEHKAAAADNRESRSIANLRQSLRLSDFKKLRDIVFAHPDFNLERGSKSREAQSAFSLEYQDEHDDFFYLCNFVKDPEAYLITKRSESSSSNQTDSAIQDAFYPHVNIVGIEDAHQVIISVRQTPNSNSAYIGINRTRTGDRKFAFTASDLCVKEGKDAKSKNIIHALQAKYPSLQKLVVVKDALLYKNLVLFDEKLKIQRHKFSVLFLKDTPTEDNVFEDTEPSPEFNRFLAFLGTKVDVSTFNGYRGDLKEGTAYHRNWQHLEFLFQISCFMPSDRRRPLIGNTITTIVYLEDGIFDLSAITSTVLHCYIIIQPLKGQMGPGGTQLYK